jgi:hypothetical protein
MTDEEREDSGEKICVRLMKRKSTSASKQQQQQQISLVSVFSRISVAPGLQASKHDTVILEIFGVK